MSHAALGSSVQLEQSHTKKIGESPVRSSAYAEYIHPFNLVPTVTQPEFDTRFHSLHDQHVKRTNALFVLSAITLMEDGSPSPATEEWLATMRQNIRDLDGQLPQFEEGRMSLLGLTGMYLSSDTSLRWSDEAEVYQRRIGRVNDLEANARMSTSPYGVARSDMRQVAAQLATDPSPQEVATLATEALQLDQQSPEFTFSKAKALFDYAATMKPSAKQLTLLSEAMSYADEAFANARGDDHFLRASALHILARSLHDASNIPRSFSPFIEQHTMLAKQARNFSVALLQQATREFQATDTEHNLVPCVPIDTSVPWAPKVAGRKDYEEARYFQDVYGTEVRIQEIFMRNTPEIEQFIATKTATKFGHNIVLVTEQYDGSQELEQYTVAA